MKNVTTAIFHDTRWPSKTKMYPIKLRLTFNRKSKFYQINNYYVTEKYFDKITGDKTREESLKKIKHELSKKEREALDIIEKLPYFTFDLFEKPFLIGQKKTDANIFNWLENAISKLKRQERIKTAQVYNSSLKSLQKYTNKSELSFYDISVDFLNAYEIWFTEDQKNSMTTLGIYLRNVRTLFNEAIEQGIIIKDAYPFGKRRYVIPTGQNVKKALNLSDIQKIYTYKSIEHSSEDRWRDMWIFSYLCNGANVKDICLLKYKNISDGKITFMRGKTKRTKRAVQSPVVAILTDEIKLIIEKWGNINKEQDDYVFPILNTGLDASKIAATIDQTTKNINKYIDRVAKAVGISKKVTTYVARHSFATVLLHSGASTEFISDSFAHADLKTTKNYLDSFEDDAKIENAKKLLAFKIEPPIETKE